MLKVGLKTGTWDLIWNASPVVKLVLLILVSFSVASWAIIFTKQIQLQRLTNDNIRFLENFWRATSLDKVFGDLMNFPSSSLAPVFKAGYQELQKIAETHLSHKGAKGPNELDLSGIENISRALRKASDNEVARMEGRTTFLATVGSSAPFIGLFGTVWGIMNSFQTIGNTGSASLAVVAPGISEALIATAIGLAAAIPSVIAYNYFMNKFRKEDLEINNFSADFLNIVKRNFFKD